MIEQGVGYTVTNSSGGQSLFIDFPPIRESLAFQAYEDVSDAGAAVFRVTPGTINQQFPTINGVGIALPNAYLPAPSESSTLVLTIPNSPTLFPSGQSSIAFVAGLVVPDSDNDNAKVGIAYVTVQDLGGGRKSYSVANLLRGSLSGTRFLNNDATYEYFYSGI
jgi:hypothetical protein